MITPSLNQADFLSDALASVARQTYPRIEHIVIDGQSTDGTLQILKAWGGRWISERDAGQADAYNKGIAMASGELLLFLSSDDCLPLVNTVECAVAAAMERPTATVIYGDTIRFDEARRVLKAHVRPDFSLSRLLRYDFIPLEAAFVRRGALIGAGFDGQYSLAMDYELWLRLAAAGHGFVHKSAVIGAIRDHGRTKSQTQRARAEFEADRVRERYGQRFGARYYIEAGGDLLQLARLKLQGLSLLSRLRATPDDALSVPLTWPSYIGMMARQTGIRETYSGASAAHYMLRRIRRHPSGESD